MIYNELKIMSEKIIFSKSMHDCITQLLVSLLGEPSFFLKISADGTKFVIIPERLSILPYYINLRMEKIAQISTNVKSIENWRKELRGVDCIKRAFIESISNSFNIFLNLVDAMRMNQISSTSFLNYDELISFTMLWHQRINYVYKLSCYSHRKCGMEIMNLIFIEWTTKCTADWAFNLLEQALDHMSVAFHKLISDWLMDGKLSSNINWIFKNENEQINLPDKKIKSVFPKSYSLNTIENFLENVKIDNKYSLITLFGCHGIIRKIFDIGRNVYFLRELRSQKIYEYKLEERMKLLENFQSNNLKLWYNISERGYLYSIIQKYYEMVSEDVMNEVMIKQRLMDHILFVQNHFLLLFGDFASAIFDSIRDNPTKDCKFANKNSSISVKEKKNFLRSNFLAHACINFALNFTSQRKVFNGLRSNFFAEKTQSSSFDSSYLEDFVRIKYKSLSAISIVLNDYTIQLYSRIFTTIIPYRIFFCRIDDISLNFIWFFKRYERFLPIEILKFLRFIQYIIFMLRKYICSILNYFFQEVLETECINCIDTMHRQTDLPSLNSSHNDFLSVITIALFLHKSGKTVYDSLRKCLCAARLTLKFIENLTENLNLEFKEKLELEQIFNLNVNQILSHKTSLSQLYTDFLKNTEEIKVQFAKLDFSLDETRRSAHWINFIIPQFSQIFCSD